MLFSTRCPVCHRMGVAPCGGCSVLIDACALVVPWFELAVGDHPALEAVVSPFAYRDEVRALVAALKFRNDRAALAWVADRMVAALGACGGAGPLGPGAVTVTWAPTSAARRRERGYDQAELLARAVARRLGARPVALLRRRPGPAMTGRALAERAGAVDFATRGRTPAGDIVLVDDVCTTGTTLRAAAAALHAAGATRVVGLVAARTPAPARGRDALRGDLG